MSKYLIIFLIYTRFDKSGTHWDIFKVFINKIKNIHMKMIILKISCSVLLLFAFATIKAQDIQMPSAQERAAKMTDWMKTNLNLTDAQLPKITDINLRYATTMDSLKNSPGDKASKMTSMQADNASKDSEIKSVLTDTQFQAYQAKEAEMKEKYKSQMKPGSGSGQ
jgi:hypothetical protein